MDYFFTEQQQMLKSLARKIAEEKVLPVRAELDEKEEFPWAIMEELADVDMFRIFIPEEYGGVGGGCLDLCLVIEEISRVCSGVAISYAANALGCYPILAYGTPEQKQRYLPDIADGKRLAAFAITESEAGSDVSAIQTSAIRGKNGYLLNGSKHFITNGGEAEIYIVIAITDKTAGDASAFIVERGTPGFSFGKKERKMGIRCSATRELIFEDCQIPKENLLSKEGMGFLIGARAWDQSRPGIGAQAVGIAQGALEEAVAYATSRIQFGRPISSLQVIQHLLADMATELEAARLLVYAVARTIDAGAKRFEEESAMAKLFASEMAMRVTTEVVQIFGGIGYMRDYPVEKMMRDAKITQIYEGTNQIQRNAIASGLLRRRAKRK